MLTQLFLERALDHLTLGRAALAAALATDEADLARRKHNYAPLLTDRESQVRKITSRWACSPGTNCPATSATSREPTATCARSRRSPGAARCVATATSPRSRSS